jgi:nicotinate-nucleotide adenylyltransferase
LTPRPPRISARRPRSLALFGGTFDPIHSGHIAVARAARRRFHLDSIHFIPAGRPPHKRDNELAPYPHRYAMVALACAGRAEFVPSALEAGADFSGRETYYSIDVVRRSLAGLHPGERLWFLIGADAFLDLPNWREPEALLDSCDFIVASRPGIDLAILRRAIPPALFAPAVAAKSAGASRTIALRNTTVHLLDSVASNVSSTEIRLRVARGRSIRGLVPAAVEDYIWKSALYR